MPDWTARSRLQHAGVLWRIGPQDAPGPEAYFHPQRQSGQLVVKWRNQLYPVMRRRRQRLTVVPVPLPAGTCIQLAARD